MMMLLVAIVTAIVVLAVHAHRRNAARERAWLAKAQYVQGTLAKCDLVSRGDDEYYWCAVEYKVRGIAYQLTGTFDYTPRDVGTKVRIAYNPKLPSDARMV